MNVECEFNLTAWTGLGLRYTCNVTSASITERCEIENFIGVHMEGKVDEDVEVISFSDTIVHFVPHGLNEFFPRLVGLSVVNCHLKELTSESLSGLDDLELLWIVSNEVTSLPEGVFDEMTRLRIVSFYDNRLQPESLLFLATMPRSQLKVMCFGYHTKINVAHVPGRTVCLRTVEELEELIESSCPPPFVREPNDFGNLWGLDRLSDYTIIVGSMELKIHKFVLAAKSKHFELMFANKSYDGFRKLEIINFSACAVEDFLHSLYTGEITIEANALEIFELASYFVTPDIKTKCEAIVVKDMSELTAFRAFSAGGLHDSDLITEAAFESIKEVYPSIELSDELQKKPKDVRLLIEADEDRQLLIMTKRSDKDNWASTLTETKSSD